MALPHWIAGPALKWGGKLLAFIAVVGGVALGLIGIRRSGRRDGRKHEQLESRAETAERELMEGAENAERMQNMSDARADGPSSRNDVVDRLRDGDA